MLNSCQIRKLCKKIDSPIGIMLLHKVCKYRLEPSWPQNYHKLSLVTRKLCKPWTEKGVKFKEVGPYGWIINVQASFSQSPSLQGINLWGPQPPSRFVLAQKIILGWFDHSLSLGVVRSLLREFWEWLNHSIEPDRMVRLLSNLIFFSGWTILEALWGVRSASAKPPHQP